MFMFGDGFGPSAFPFAMFGFMFTAVFVLVIVVFVVVIVRGIGTWRKNNHAPVLTVPALVVAKRGQNATHRHGHDTVRVESHTTYYATFQFESGDRLELSVQPAEYGYLIEGDQGKLTFQGTRFLSFARDGAPSGR